MYANGNERSSEGSRKEAEEDELKKEKKKSLSRLFLLIWMGNNLCTTIPLPQLLAHCCHASKINKQKNDEQSYFQHFN